MRHWSSGNRRHGTYLEYPTQDCRPPLVGNNSSASPAFSQGSWSPNSEPRFLLSSRNAPPNCNPWMGPAPSAGSGPPAHGKRQVKFSEIMLFLYSHRLSTSRAVRIFKLRSVKLPSAMPRKPATAKARPDSIDGAAACRSGRGAANALKARTSQGADADAARLRALAAYKGFLTLWKDADPDIPIYKQAKAEYAKQQSKVIAPWLRTSLCSHR